MSDERKNMRVRKAMFLAGMSQEELGKLLGLSGPDISKLMKFELAKAEQDDIIRKIKAAP